MTKMNRRNLLKTGGGMAAASLVAPGIAWGQAAGPMTIGCAGPFTGPNAAFGEQLRRGTNMAVADMNGAGGLLGRQLAVVFEDDASDPNQARAAANRLAQRRVPFVLGHFNSSCSIPASEVYAEENILQITPASTNPRLTDRGARFRNVFRTCGRDDQQGAIAGNWLAQRYAGKAVAIIHDKTTYGQGLADETKKAMNARGLTERLYDGVTVGDKDFTALITRMKSLNIEAIYFGGLHTEAALLVRQAREQALAAQLVSGDGIVSAEFATIAGRASDGVIMTFDSDPRKNPAAAEVVRRFAAQNYDPEGYTLLSYAAVQVFAEAARRANGTALNGLVTNMHGRSFDTVIGRLTYDTKGDLTQPNYVFYIWKDGKYAEM
jgi:branched-chain amino acid transport system substrate-binding protein